MVSEHQHNSDVSENRPSEQRLSSLEKHVSDIQNIPEYCRHLAELQDLDLDLGLLLLLETLA